MMRVVLLALMTGCAAHVGDGDGGETYYGRDCAVDDTAEVFLCGDGWRVVWPDLTLLCGEPGGDCTSDASGVEATICDDDGGRVLWFADGGVACAVAP